MEVGTTLAVVAFADQVLKYGNKFVKRCRGYLHAEDEAIELLISIESNWIKMETQIAILKKIAPSLSVKLQNMQSQILSQLEGKLKTASLIIEQLILEKKEVKKKWEHDERDIVTKVKDFGDMKATKKAKYVARKNSLIRTVEDIEKWQARYDPSWILIMQSSIGNIDKELEEQEKKAQNGQIPIIIAAKGIRDAVKVTQGSRSGAGKAIWIDADEVDLDPCPIPFSSVEMSTLENEKEIILIDSMISNAAANANSVMKDVRNLARVLTEVDPSTFGLLRCKGVIKVPRNSVHALQSINDYKFIFDVPRGLTQPQSLRAILISGITYPLDQRLDLAKQLTSSILFVHTVQFVHKNIRPETIIVFQNENSDIGAPFLAGFEQFRLEDGQTYLNGDDEWEKNLYRHPDRQGLHPEVSYQMQHDIYSLGVVLLEIGLWTSFVAYKIADDAENRVERVRNSLLGSIDPDDDTNPRKIASENKSTLEKLAEGELPQRLGSKYTDIVLLCLRVLDTGSSDESDKKEEGFGVGIDDKHAEYEERKPWIDEDGVVIGVSYIENVLTKMQEINV